MSAYLVHPDHVKELAAFAVQRRFGGQFKVDPRYLNLSGFDKQSELATAEFYSNLLWRENVKSVRYRYEDAENMEDLPSSGETPEEITFTFHDLRRRVINPVHILKMCAGYRYQACEHPGWRESKAAELLSRIEYAAINDLPGYDDAPWSYERPDAPSSFHTATLVRVI